jgi:hypothetical protein
VKVFVRDLRLWLISQRVWEWEFGGICFSLQFIES